MQPSRNEGEWSVNGEVFHTCGGSEGCMCIYSPENNPGLKAELERREAEMIERIAEELYASGPWGEFYAFADQGARAITDAHDMRVYREMARLALLVEHADDESAGPRLFPRSSHDGVSRGES